MRAQPPSEPSHYVLGYREASHSFLSARTATQFAWFFTPHLRPGLRLLDCGCGPGSITLDFAELIVPGEAIGIDVEPLQIERSRELARERGIGNARFEVGDIHSLPFPDASFDAVFAAHTLEHLPDPRAAIKEMRRALKPGGVIGLVDPDYGAFRMEPETSRTREYLQLQSRLHERVGSPHYAPKQRRVLRELGFVGCQAFAFADCYAAPDVPMRTLAQVWIDGLNDPKTAALAAENGWADAARLAELIEGVREWGDDPDSLFVRLLFGAVGWLDPSP